MRVRLLAYAALLMLLVAHPAWAVDIDLRHSDGTKTTLSGTGSAADMTLTTLLSGEDQTNNLLMTSGGVVRSSVMASAVTTDTTSAAVEVPTGTKTFYGSVDGTGAVTQTQIIYGGLTSGVTATNGEPICTFTLSGTTHAHGACVSTAPWLFYIVVTSNTTGTSATGAVTAQY
ncbi:MAG: hypothetical protein ACYCZR_00980 [Burkholderiales bacterium]